ncbi:MAG: Ig-like domain-containing protein [Longimicrobiales bacterium]|nr:Ig-like domain-containing protein [Longimicrobiales bacterium]
MIRTNARLRRALGPPLLAGALGACGDASTAPVIPVATRLELGRDTLTLFVPANTTLTPVVLDQSGAPMAGAAVSFASRDTTTARVDPAGAVTGVAAGETWVVGTSGVAVDSARVTVRYHVLAGETRARVRGADGRD